MIKPAHILNETGQRARECIKAFKRDHGTAPNCLLMGGARMQMVIAAVAALGGAENARLWITPDPVTGQETIEGLPVTVMFRGDQMGCALIHPATLLNYSPAGAEAARETTNQEGN